jgi:hypothetical protein
VYFMQELSVCSRLELDASRSVGFAGRPWKSISWELLSSDLSDDAYLRISESINTSSELILKLVPSQNSSISDWAAFFPEGDYKVRLSLTNWAMSSTSSDFHFRKSSATSYFKIILNPKHAYQTIYRSTTLQYQGYTLCCDCLHLNQNRNCIDVDEEVPSTFEWTISSSEGMLFDGSSLDRQSPSFYIPPFTLLSGYSYTINIKASSTACGKDQIFMGDEESITVFVHQKAAHAVIEGGDRVLSNQWKSALVLNANASRNSNFADSSIAKFALAFSWQCRYRGNWSDLGWQDCDSSIFAGRARCNSSVCILDQNSTKDGTTYIFTVTVSPLILLWKQPITGQTPGVCTHATFSSLYSAGMLMEQIAMQCAANATLAGQASVQLFFVKSNPPVVTLDIVSPLLTEHENFYIDSHVGLAVPVCNIDDSFTLLATIRQSTSITSIQWKLENYPGVSCQGERDWCNPTNLRSNQKVVAPGVLGDTTNDACNTNHIAVCTSSLSFLPYALQGLGTYNFSIFVVESSGETGRASILVRINHAPYGGTLKISPTRGLGLTDTFIITTIGWFDPDQQDDVIDKYLFTYKENGCVSSNCEIILASDGRNRIQTLLPAGNITVFVYATDQYGATSRSVGQTIWVDLPPNLEYVSSKYLQSPSQDISQLLGLISSLGITLKKMEGSQNDVAKIRATGIVLIRNSVLQIGWSKSLLNSPTFAIFILQSISAIVYLLSNNLSSEAKRIAFDMLSEAGNAILGFTALNSNENAMSLTYFPEAQFAAYRLSEATGYLFGKDQIRYLTNGNARGLSFVGPYFMNGQEENFGSDLSVQSDDQNFNVNALSQQSVNLLDFIQLISMLGASVLLAGGSSFHANEVFYETTTRDTGFQISSKNLMIPTESDFRCLAEQNAASCCIEKSSEQCCVGAFCSGNALLLTGPKAAIVSSQSSPLDPLQLYDFTFAYVGGKFSSFTPDTILSSVMFLQIRPSLQTYSPLPYILLRIYMTEEVVNFLTSNSRTTLGNEGYFAACQNWNFQSNSWSSDGIENYENKFLPQKMCKFNRGTNLTECFHFMECLAKGLSLTSPSLIGIIRRELDCAQLPLGTQTYDACGVCGGTNSTCSGCNNVPFEKAFGDLLTKDCSGHGTCSGGPTCKCCSDAKDLLEGRTCPWFGIMCNLFCTRDKLSGSTQYATAKNWIHCNSHGQCDYDSSTGNVACRCDSGYADQNDTVNSRCGYLVPIVQQDDPNFVLFLKIGVPIIAAVLVCGISAAVCARRMRNKAVLGRKTVENVVLKLPRPTLEEVGVSSQQATKSQKGKLRPKIEDLMKRKAAAKLAREANLDRIDLNTASLPHDKRNLAIPAASVSAFVTTSRFEVDSDVVSTDDFALKRTFQRLAKLKSNVESNPMFSSEELAPHDMFRNEESIALMVKAGSRHPVSFSHPEASNFSRLSKGGNTAGIKEQERAIQTELNVRQREVNLQSQYGPGSLNLPPFMRERLASKSYNHGVDPENEAFV